MDNIEKYLKDFSDYMKSIKHLSDNTADSYCSDVNNYLIFLKNNRIEKPSEALSTDIRNYAEKCGSDGLSDSSITRLLAAVRAFYKYLILSGELSISPAEKIRFNKTKEIVFPDILTRGEINLLLDQPDTKSIKGVRDKAILEIMYATGIRVSEMIVLNISDINFEYMHIMCRNSREERAIPIYDSAAEALKRYLEIREASLHENNSALFLNMSGGRLTRQGAWKMIKNYAVSSKIPFDITPHTIRHSFAMHMLENGAPLKSVQRLLGHADSASTKIYVKMMKERNIGEYQIYHPRAQKQR